MKQPLRAAVLQMGWRLQNVAQGALQRCWAVDDHSHPQPGDTGAAAHVGPFNGSFWPTWDDVLDGAVFAFVHRSMVFGLPLSQLCNQLLLLMPLLLGLDLHQQRGCVFFGIQQVLYLAMGKHCRGFSQLWLGCTLGSCCLASWASNFSLMASSCFFFSSFSSTASCWEGRKMNYSSDLSQQTSGAHFSTLNRFRMPT